MNRTLGLLAFVGIAVGLYFATSADAQGPTPIPSVWLQPTTPGTIQTGNININGDVKSGPLFAVNPALSGIAVRGQASSTGASSNIGVFGQADGVTGIGVRGSATSVTGTNYGGYFISASSSSGAGVYGLGKTGIRGIGSGSSGITYGVYGDSSSLTGYGVYTRNHTVNNPAVVGEVNTTTNVGVWGRNILTGSNGYLSRNQDGVEGVSGFSGGRAGYFHTQTGQFLSVELAGPNGAINTNGFLYREYTSTTRSAAIPIAYGNIAANGAINSGTGNFTVVSPPSVTGEYEITIAGETYDPTSFAVFANVNVNGQPYVACVADGGVSIRISVWNLVTVAKTNFGFNFVVYKSDPTAPGDFAPENNGGTGEPIIKVPATPEPRAVRPKR